MSNAAKFAINSVGTLALRISEVKSVSIEHKPAGTDGQGTPTYDGYILRVKLWDTGNQSFEFEESPTLEGIQALGAALIEKLEA